MLAASAMLGCASEPNRCPRVDSLIAAPDDIPEGGSSTVSVVVTDPDGDRLTTALTATSGSFEDPAARSTRYTCGSPGIQTISVSVSDGDNACDTTKSVEVQCGGIPCFTQSDYELVWADEFDGSAVDPAKWEFQLGDGSQFGIPGWGNNELQWYTADNATVADGLLTIQAREESVGPFNYTSSRLRSLGRGDWTYGRFEMRARLPEGQGLWSAFWMFSSDPSIYGPWAACGEIDIMESIGSDPEAIFGTIHYGGTAPGNASSGAVTSLPTGTVDDFHEYAIEWLADEIRWCLDGKLYATKTDWFSTGGPFPAPFDVDFHLLLNLAVGGNFPGDPDSSTVFPQSYVIDYVRVYQQPAGDASGSRIIFDLMEHSNPFGHGWFIFDGAAIGPNSTDVPPKGGSFSLDASFESSGGYLGGFGRGRARDLSGAIEFSFWINPDPDQSYVIEVNLQDDDTGDADFTPGLDDEFQFDCVVSPSGPCATSGGGWQKVTIPLTSFFDDNSFSNGGNGTLDVNGGSEGLLLGVVMAITEAAADASFRTDQWVFHGPGE